MTHVLADGSAPTLDDSGTSTAQLTSEVLRNALVVAAEEASIVVVRSAFSTFVVEVPTHQLRSSTRRAGLSRIRWPRP